MVTKISELIADYYSFISSDSHHPNVDLADFVLEGIEKVGMLPPSTDYFIRNQPLGFTQTWEEVADYHQWEPEEK